MKKIVYLSLFIFISFSISLSGQSIRKLKIKEVTPNKNVPIRECGNPKHGYLAFITDLHNLDFNTGEYNKIHTDSSRAYIKGYILCVNGRKDFAITISDAECKETVSVKLAGWYKIKKKKDILRTIFYSRNNYLAIKLGKGFSYSPTGGGLGASIKYRSGENFGWGLQVGVGYFFVDAVQRTGILITSGTHSTKKAMYFPHFSVGIKCYPLLRIKELPYKNFLPSLARNFYVGINYGILGTKKFDAYNDDNGNFSLGGLRTMNGVSVLVGEDWLFPIGRKKTNGIIVNAGVGFAYSINMKNWMFAYDVAAGWYWKLNKNK